MHIIINFIPLFLNVSMYMILPLSCIWSEQKQHFPGTLYKIQIFYKLYGLCNNLSKLLISLNTPLNLFAYFWKRPIFNIWHTQKALGSMMGQFSNISMIFITFIVMYVFVK